ncbi:hypothetical protein HT031_001627 [Scenedesmus sp. PABB004]|nr:hypothetical protein HT031_001627 [Scenedesmus sp. PABB004]
MVVLRRHVSYFLFQLSQFECPMTPRQIEYLRTAHLPVVLQRGATMAHVDRIVQHLAAAMLSCGAQESQINMVAAKLKPFVIMFPETPHPAPKGMRASMDGSSASDVEAVLRELTCPAGTCADPASCPAAMACPVAAAARPAAAAACPAAAAARPAAAAACHAGVCDSAADAEGSCPVAAGPGSSPAKPKAGCGAQRCACDADCRCGCAASPCAGACPCASAAQQAVGGGGGEPAAAKPSWLQRVFGCVR